MKIAATLPLMAALLFGVARCSPIAPSVNKTVAGSATGTSESTDQGKATRPPQEGFTTGIQATGLHILPMRIELLDSNSYARMMDSMDDENANAVFLGPSSLSAKFEELRSHGSTEIESPVKVPEEVTIYLGFGLSKSELQAVEMKSLKKVLSPVSETLWSLNFNSIGSLNLVTRLMNNLENAVIVFGPVSSQAETTGGNAAISATPSSIPSPIPSVSPSPSPSSVPSGKPSPAPSPLPVALHGPVEIKI